MAVSSLSLNWVSTTLSKKSNESTRATTFSFHNSINCPTETTSNEESNCGKRRLLLLGAGVLTSRLLLPASPLFAEETQKNFQAFVDKIDGYSYIYPSDWIDFDFRGHDSAFKDRYLQLQNLRVRFIPTEKKDIHEMGPLEEVVSNLTRHVYAAPNQVTEIMGMQDETRDGKNYYTFEYRLTSPNYSSSSFACVAIANGRYYTFIVGANDRRWKRVRNKLKIVADSFKVLDI